MIKTRSISRIFHQTGNSLHRLSSCYIYSNALPRADKQRLLSQQKLAAKSDYERSCTIRKMQYKKLKKELEVEKEEHHHIFSKIFYNPSFPDHYRPTKVSKLDARPHGKPKPFHKQRCGLMAKKVGMMTMFDSKGVYHPVTILKVDCLQVVQIRHIQNPRHGTFNLQLGYGTELMKNIKWPELGTFNAHNVAPKERLMEFECGHEALIKPGTELTVRHFLVGQFVDVKGRTKDKGFQGVMKRWGFKGGPATHGSSKFHRRRGAMGGSMDPGKVWKGKRMPGHMGNKNHTRQNLRVFRIEPKQNLIYLIGNVPSQPGKIVRIRDAHFKPPKKPPFPTFIPHPNERELPEFQQWGGDKRNLLWNRDPNSDDWKDDRVSNDLL